MKPKYPARLFAFNLILNVTMRYWYLLIPGVVLCLFGIRAKICLALGVAFLLGDLAVSLVDQLRARKASLLDPTDDAYNDMMDAALAAGGPDEFRTVVQKSLDQKQPPQNPQPKAPTEEPKLRHPYE